MGLPFQLSEVFGQSDRLDSQRQRLAKAESGTVTISLEADCLRRLLRHKALHVEDFSCLDECSKTNVRRMLLDLLAHDGNHEH